MTTNSFANFNISIQKHFYEMQQDANSLFVVQLDKDRLWNLYLDSFPEGTNRIFRKRREFDCSCCRQFIRSIGNVVTIKDNEIHTIWELSDLGPTYQPVADALDEYVKQYSVCGVYISKYVSKIGIAQNHEKIENGRIVAWGHLHLELPERFVDKSSASIGALQNQYSTSKEVFKRALDEISMEAIETVLELIHDGSLYRGKEYEWQVDVLRKQKAKYDILPSEKRDNYAWSHSVYLLDNLTYILNTAIGTLLKDLTDGVDLDAAVRKYEAITAPENYKRPKPIYTKRMLEEARKTVTELGYLPSLRRRFATLDDIRIGNLLFVDRCASKRIKDPNDIFAEMSQEVTVDPSRFSSRVRQVPIEKFVTDILPNARSIQVLLENRHAANMVSLIAPANPEAPSMFKWPNGFSWAYTGNITDSSIRENVKIAGGKVDGALRFSIQWNDGTKHDPNDLDAHCVIVESDGKHHIYYATPRDYVTLGTLDVDIRHPQEKTVAVENIIFPSRGYLVDGTYHFYVKNYMHRGGTGGFKAEIEFEGETYSFEYPHPIGNKEEVPVATVTFSHKNGFTIKPEITSKTASKELWGLHTNQFAPVTAVMRSPNYWDEQSETGNLHYFFMLNGCVNPETPNGFYNEFLKSSLAQHRKVFEALGSKMAVEKTDQQLSGLGFSSTRRNKLIVKVVGETEQIVNVIF